MFPSRTTTEEPGQLLLLAKRLHLFNLVAHYRLVSSALLYGLATRLTHNVYPGKRIVGNPLEQPTMKDPFFLEPIPWLSKAVQPFANYFNLPTLPLHIHEVLAAALLYTVVFYPLSPMLSNLLAGKHYSTLSRKKRLNWDAHVVSMVQSLLINSLALWVMAVDKERAAMDQDERIWGYTGAAAFIQALGAGYFVWDLFVTAANIDVFGPGTLAHAISALVVYSMGFVSRIIDPCCCPMNPKTSSLTNPLQRPFVNYYSCNFILWELSTPFLNVHWFMDKVNMTGSKAQLYNGFLLLGSFFMARLVYGTYQSYRVFNDIWSAVGTNPSTEKILSSSLMLYATPKSEVPFWLASSYLACNLVLNFLNFFWFFKMVTAVTKRFQPAKTPSVKADGAVSSTATGVSTSQAAARRRLA